MKKLGPVIRAAFLLFMAAGVAASAQTPDNPRMPRPGQNPQNAPGVPPRGVAIGEIHWYPVSAYCTFFRPEQRAAFDFEDPSTWRFVFLTMRERVGSEPESAIERGYVMANGLLRELEKGKVAPDAQGNLTIVWRSAGEPRINVNAVLQETGQSAESTSYTGSITIFWGDKKETVEIVGGCGV